MRDDTIVYSKSVRAKLDQLEKRKHAAEWKVREIERQIAAIITGQSAIKVGDIIVWASANRERRGRVLSISALYRGFSFRVVVLTKGNREIGNATVEEQHHPVLEG